MQDSLLIGETSRAPIVGTEGAKAYVVAAADLNQRLKELA